MNLVSTIKEAFKYGVAFFIECRGVMDEELNKGIFVVEKFIDNVGVWFLYLCMEKYFFSKEEDVYKVYWDVRKGFISMVGFSREVGMFVFIEDVVCEVDKFGNMMKDLIVMFEKFGYDDVFCMGYVLEGNLYLVFF